jgi:glycosyltransferase involved in cell wall biosynthesis
MVRKLAPRGSRLGRVFRYAHRALEVGLREGPSAVPVKLFRKIATPLISGSKARAMSRVPWRADDRPVFLMIHNQGGGGTERHVRELITRLRGEGIGPIEVYAAPSRRIAWEERDPTGKVTWLRANGPDPRSVRALLELLRPVHAHVHNMMGLPQHFLDSLIGFGVAFDWTVHDYFPICPRAHLNRADDAYCGEPDERECDACLSRLGDYKGTIVHEPISKWRERNGRYLRRARRVFVPSEDAARRLARYFPDLVPTLRPHPGSPSARGVLAARPRADGRVRVAVIGNIVGTKGSKLLLACARHALDQKLPLEFVVVGKTDRDAVFARLGNVRVTGPYPEVEVYRLLAEARCQLALLPTPIPETFMYTLTIAMASGFYTLCLDIGAQAERLKAWGWGRALPLDAGPETVIRAILDSPSLLPGVPPPPPTQAIYPDILMDYYDFHPGEVECLRSGPRTDARAVTQPVSVQRNAHARVH